MTGLKLISILLIISVVNCEEKAAKLTSSSIATQLLDCYNETAISGITSPQNHLPSTINILVDLIRKLEQENDDKDIREMTEIIIRQFKQDGIIKSYRETSSPFSLPYAARGRDASKFRMILDNFLGESEATIRTETLTPIEKCSLHFLISSSMERNVVLENDICPSLPKSKQKYREPSAKSVNSTQQLRCILEQGVLSTNWGNIKIGNVLTGLITSYNAEKNPKNGVDSIMAGTLAGVLAEAAFFNPSPDVTFGIRSNFNSTLNPKTSFFSDGVGVADVGSSEADLLGALDSVLVAYNKDNINKNYGDIKLSQLLDLYYSAHGVDERIRPCNRSTGQTEYFDTNDLEDQVSKIFSLISEYGGTTTSITDPEALAKTIVEKFISSSDSLPKVNCDDSTSQQTNANILIFLDGGWKNAYNRIQSALAYILDHLDINIYQSSYSVQTCEDQSCSYIVNQTSHIVDFHQYYNSDTSIKEGISYASVFEAILKTAEDNLQNSTYAGGKTNIALIVPYNSKIDSNNIEYIRSTKDTLLNKYSNVQILVFGSGTNDDYSELVNDPSTDIVLITTNENDDETPLKTAADKIIERIKSEPKPVINPKCGKDFVGDTSTFKLEDQFVDYKGIQYYKIAPSYFSIGDDRKLKISVDESFGTVKVCQSQDDITKVDESNCKTENEVTYQISDICDGCNAIYISVEGTSSKNQCKEALCRYPNSIKYSISLEQVGCKSDAIHLLGNLSLISILFFLLKF